MQTSQVTNPANVLSSPAPAGKQADNNAATESFGQVLSREVADRKGTSEAAKTQDAAKQDPAKQAHAAGARPAKSKVAENKAKVDADAPDAAVDAASQISDEMLALVANLNQIVAPVAESGEAKPTVQDAQIAIAIDPALALAAIPALKADQSAATTPTPVVDDGAQRKAEPSLALAGLAGDDRQQLESPAATKTDMQAAMPALDLAAKGQELLNGTSKQAGTPDFATAMKDTAATINSIMPPVQPNPLQATHALAAHAANKLAPQVGTPAWDQALGQKVVWMVAGEQQSASLTLNPPDLGPLQVVLNVSNSHASATFTAAQPEVRQALEAALPKLREMLGDAGIQLGQATVNSGSPNQQNASDQQASQARRGGEGDNRNDAASQPARVGRVQPAVSGQGLVDTFA